MQANRKEITEMPAQQDVAVEVGELIAKLLGNSCNFSGISPLCTPPGIYDAFLQFEW